MKLLISSIFLLLIAPCNGSKKLSKAENVPQADHSQLLITYRRGACMGTCPDYTMSISGESKMITYTGRGNVTKLGTYTKPISELELSKLVKAFEVAGFQSLEERYLGEIVDKPSRYITYRNKGVEKKVQDRAGAPDKLHELEKTLDAIADSPEGWTKSAESGN